LREDQPFPSRRFVASDWTEAFENSVIGAFHNASWVLSPAVKDTDSDVEELKTMIKQLQGQLNGQVELP